MYGTRYQGKRTRTADENLLLQTLGRVFFFPLLLVYLELLLHLSMGMEMKYALIYICFSLAGGLFFSACTMPWKRLVNHVLAKTLAGLISLVYAVEFIAKQILQAFYPFSTVGLAAENKLWDYRDAIWGAVLENWLLLLLFFLPWFLLLLFGRWMMGFGRLDVRFAGITAGMMLLFHLIGLGVIHLPWEGDLTPAKLYRVDSNLDDQVEQLGLLNMLRLDLKHQIVPAGTLLDDDFSALSPDIPVAETPGPEQPEEPVSSQPVVDRSPNVMDVDLAALAESSGDKDVQWLAKYFNSVQPSNKNEYTGMFEGYNVIFFTLEGFSGYAIDPVLTPTLYRLQTEGFVFNNYYTALHFTSTSGGECQNLLGLYPKNGNPASLRETGRKGTNAYFSLAQQLGRAGYLVKGYHGNSNMYDRLQSHTNLGYDWNQLGSGEDYLFDLSESGKLLWPQRDSYTVEHSVEEYINSEQPFHVYYLTISGHMPYSDNRIVAPYRDIVRALPYSETTQNYLATAMEVDRALEVLLQKLEQAGKLDKTLIVASPDHIPYFNVDILEELSGQSFGKSEDLERLNESNINFDVYKSSLILWSASMEEPVQVDKVCSQVDILPTLSNLLGLEYDSRMLSGTDVLADNTEPVVVFTSRSWLTEKGLYHRATQTFTPAEGVSMTAEEQEHYVSAMKKLVGYKLDCTQLILNTDFYSVALK